VRFSLQAYVKDTDQVFSAHKISSLMTDSTVYTRGDYDGSGKSIDRTFVDYYSRFTYDEDLSNAPQLALNHRLGVSTTIDNSADFYSGAMVVEFYLPGFDPQYASMDWHSLRLVFMEDDNTW
jgi:hypothetical protein